MTDLSQQNSNHLHKSRPDDELDLMSLLIIILQQKFSVLSILIMGVVLTFFLLSTVQPRYTAKSHILLQFDLTNTLPQQLISATKKSFFDVEKILTEIEVLKSRKLASHVVKELALTKDPEFSPASVLDLVTPEREDVVQSKFRELSVDGTKMKTFPPEVLDPEVSRTVTNFLESLKVSQVPGSTVLAINFTSTNPYKASFITNKIIEEYQNLKTSEVLEQREKVSNWLDTKLEALRKSLLDTEIEIENFKKEKNIDVYSPEILSEKQVLNFVEDYNQEKQRQSELKLQITQLSNKDNTDIITAINSKDINTSLIRELIKNKIDIEKEISDFSNRYGPKHPYMIKLKSEVENTEASIQKEISKAKKVLNEELNLVTKRVNELAEETGIETKPAAQDISSEDLIHLRNLENEAESLRVVLKEFLESYKKYIGKEDIQTQDIQVISYASVPITPSFPNKPLILSLSVLLSLILGIFIAVLRGKMKNYPSV